LVELAFGSNTSFMLGGYTPPCPWQADLNQDGKVVGTGAFGEVFTATVKCQSSPPFSVAIKKFKASSKSQVENEAKIMDKFSSKHFVKVYGMGKSTRFGSNVFYILMEAAEGGSFEGYVKRAGDSVSAYNTAVNLFLDALEGLAEMHGMEYHHRDIKPDNILVTKKCGTLPGTCHGKIADLGESCHARSCDGLHGTPYYVAPELLKYEFNSRRNDVWSMGVILFRILNNGKLPSKFRNSLDKQRLYSQINSFNVEAESEYRAMPEGGLKSLLAEMLKSDVRNRLSSLEALDWALRAVKGCGVLTSEGAICPADQNKVVQLLPSCWAGSHKGDWQPTSAIKQELKVQLPRNPLVEKPIDVDKLIAKYLPNKPKVQRFEIETDFLVDPAHVKQPETGKHKVQKYEIETDFLVGPAPLKRQVPFLVEQDTARIDAHREKKHLITFAAMELGIVIVEQTGAVSEVHEGQAKRLGVQPGWFIEEIAGLPFADHRLEYAIDGTYGNTFTMKFREPLILEYQYQPPEDNENPHVQTTKGKQASIKVFTIQFPQYSLGLGFLFQGTMVKDGIFQRTWNYLGKQIKIGLPFKPGDQLVSVNNEQWMDVVKDQEFVTGATSGNMGPLTFLYMAED
jgi:serine/threonine protein kinase